MKIGVMLPVGGNDGPTGGMPTWADTKAMAVAADEAGLDSVWLADHYFYKAPDDKIYGMHESWTLLSAVAAVTERVEVGNMVLCSSFRDPGLTAKMAATLDLVSDGRLILGVGAGWHDPEYDAFGLPTDHRVGRFEEWLEIVARLLRHETVTFDGKYHHVKDLALEPPPARQIPILVAALRPRMLELTAKWADQWNTAWFGPVDDKLKGRIESMQVAQTAADRTVELTVGITVTDLEQAAVAEPEANTLNGTVEDLAQSFKEYEALGVTHLIAGTEPMTPRSAERLAQAKHLAFS
jgi:alkanesulfonate monooxygenase SsuD/methylene tetrahydromethanopterin reductase-like flavin-dependent oxidoreductase (luciferase family)